MNTSKFKIVFLSDDFPPQSFGGAGMIAYEEAQALSELGHDVIVVTAVDKKEEEGESLMGKIKIYKIFSSYDQRFRAYVSLNNSRVIRNLDNILKEEKPDIVHAHNIHIHISYKALEVASRYTQNVFLTAHDFMLVHYGKFLQPKSGNLKVSALQNLFDYKLQYNPFRNILIRRYLKHVKTIFAVSNSVKKFLEMNGIKKVHTLHNGIDERRFDGIDQEKKNAWAEKYGLVGKKVLLFVGRISGLKGGEQIRKAFKKVGTKIPEARLLMVGKVSNINKDEEEDKNIIYTGFVSRDEIKYLYTLADVVVVPSLYVDPFVIVNVEAMANHKPVVGTCFGGTKEIVEDKETGIIVDPNDLDSLSGAIIDLFQDPKKREEYGEAGYRRFIEKFTIKTHTKALIECYNTFSLHD
jgi:glycosyltransferase involved in cell wall biosynthesis